MYLAVTVPTHKLSHFAMFRSTDDIVCSTTLTRLISSHHYCIIIIIIIIITSIDLSGNSPDNNAEHEYSKKVAYISYALMQL